MACGGCVAARLAVAASPEVQYRISLQTQSDDPGDQPGHVGKREPFRTALSQVRAERVIEPTPAAARAASPCRAGGAGVPGSLRDIPNRTVLAR